MINCPGIGARPRRAVGANPSTKSARKIRSAVADPPTDSSRSQPNPLGGLRRKAPLWLFFLPPRPRARQKKKSIKTTHLSLKAPNLFTFTPSPTIVTAAPARCPRRPAHSRAGHCFFFHVVSIILLSRRARTKRTSIHLSLHRMTTNTTLSSFPNRIDHEEIMTVRSLS